MFSRAAKSVVKNLGQQKYYVSEGSIKVKVIGTAEEIGQTLSQYAKTGSKLNDQTIPNLRQKSRLLMMTAAKLQSFKTSQTQQIQDPGIDSYQQKCQRNNNTVLSFFANRELDLERTVMELRDKGTTLVSGNGHKKQSIISAKQPMTDFPRSETKVDDQMWVLSQIPAGQQDLSASRWQQLGQTRSEGLSSHTSFTTQSRNAGLRISRIPKATSEEYHASVNTLTAKQSAEPPHRSQNDDYFPQGDDYEEEIGSNDYGRISESKKSSKYRSRKRSTDDEDDHDNFSPVLIASMKGPSSPIIRSYTIENMEGNVLAKNISEGDTQDSLQALVEKVEEFKRRIFGTGLYKSNTDGKIEAKDGKKREIPEINRPRNSRGDRIATIAEKLWLSDSDCGEGLPDRPKRSPYHPPDGPCVPMKKPGYPAKPRASKKDFCFNCPPKKPCNLNKCPPDACKGTCGNVDVGRRDLLKLNSKSQANRSDTRSSMESKAIRYLATSTWNGNRPHHHQANHLRGIQRQFCSSCDGSKSPKKLPKESKCVENECIDKPKPSEPHCRPIPAKCNTPETVIEPKVLYQKCPPLPKLPKLPECPKVPKIEAQKPCPKIIPPKCPLPPKVPKCPECPKPLKPKAQKSCPKIIPPECPPPPNLPRCPECPKPPEPKTETPCAKTLFSTEKIAANSGCHTDRLDQHSPSKGSLTKEHDGHHGDYPLNSHCCATVPKKNNEKKQKKRKKKKNSLSDKIKKCTKREMSTYVSQIFKYFEGSNSEIRRRHLCTSGIFSSSHSSKNDPPSSSSHPQWKSQKCKTVEDVCSEDVNPKLKALECKPEDCSKKPNSLCYPKKPRCAEVRKPLENKFEKHQIVTKKTKSGFYGDNMENYRPPVIFKPVEKIDYTKRQCESPKLIKLGPCPVPPPIVKKKKGSDHCRKGDGKDLASSQPLPKPPSAPVHLCPCLPPPKLPPGSCPDYAEIEESPNILTEPCATKQKYPRPEKQVYYCPPLGGRGKTKNVCHGDKKKTPKT